MTVTVAEGAGFCFGVQRAVDGMFDLLQRESRPILSFGPLIHNPQITDELERRGVRVVDAVPEAFEGVVALRSHGVPREIKQQLAQRGIASLDLICPFVQRIHNAVSAADAEGLQVLVVGHAAHPEVVGIRSYARDTVAVDSLEALQHHLEANPQAAHLPTLVVVQTTFDTNEWEKCKNFVEKAYTKAQISDTICYATENRQKQAEALAAESDVMLVIGGRHSSNTNRLAELCRRHCNTVLLLESAAEIPPALFWREAKVGITAGASTPAYVIKEAANKMSDINEAMNPETTTAEAVESVDETATGDIAAASVDVAESASAAEPTEELHPAEETAAAEAPAQAEEAAAAQESTPAEETTDETDSGDGEMSFEQMLEESLLTLNTGDRVKVTILSIGATEVTVDLGTKHTAYIPVGELSDDPNVKPEELVKPGDEIEAFVVRVNDVEGTIMLSKKRVDAIKGWDEIEAAVDSGAVLEGNIVEVVKGGIIALCNGTRVFIPGSQVTGGRDADHSKLVGTVQKFKILEVNRRRRRVIGSIRAVAREARRVAEEAFWGAAEVDKHYNGVVKSLTSYGAFVDIGGVDGMVHLSELSWNKIRHPSEVVSVGDEIEVYIKDLDPERKRVSLGYKNLQPNPWDTLKTVYQEGDIARVTVVKLMPFGAFAQLIPGIDGLIYISQISTRRIDKPASELSVGDQVNVKVVSIDYEAMRVNLSIRALLEEGYDVHHVRIAPVEEALEEMAPPAEPEPAAAEEAPAEEIVEAVEEAPAEVAEVVEETPAEQPAEEATEDAAESDEA